MDARGIAAGLGPALLVGTALVVSILIVALVLGVPLTPAVAVGVSVLCAGTAGLIRWFRGRRWAGGEEPISPDSSRCLPSRRASWFRAAPYAVAGGYVAFGAFAMARLPTVGDDARIWSLKGLTLAYYHRLQPEIFLNPHQAGGHPVYPLFQPVIEALLSEFSGRPQLRLYHAELWLLFVLALWTAGYLLAWRRHSAVALRPWIGILALVAVTPLPAVNDILLGDADILGSTLLATGALAIALWLEVDDVRFLALAPLLLGAAANTKDEDLLGALLVVVVAGVAALTYREDSSFRTRSAAERLGLWVAAAGCLAALAAPWRIWTAAHHLSDAVEPPLPHALSPVYLFDRLPQLHTTATSMINQALIQWGWVAALFLAVCMLCLVTRKARRMAVFYLVLVAVLAAALLWLYTTTPVNLTFLLDTSMDRTVDVFLVPAALGTAHLLAMLLKHGSERTRLSLAGPAR